MVTALAPVSVTARQCLVLAHDTTVGRGPRPSRGVGVQDAPSHSRACPVLADVATQNDAVVHDTDVNAGDGPLTVV